MTHRLHVVGLPHTHTTRDFSACAYTQKVRKFCDMMMAQGNEVYLYAGEQNEAACTEHVSCLPEEERVAAVGGRPYVDANWDPTKPPWPTFTRNATREIRKRAKFTDTLCVIGGTSHKPIADNFNGMRCVEFGIGYSGTFAPFRVWESYAWMHAVYGAQSKSPMNADGYWFDAVIPGFVDTSVFKPPVGPRKDEYLLYVGRMVDRKGIHVAIEVAKRAGKQLIFAGPGKAPIGTQHVGEVSDQGAANLMADASAVLMPTLYLEPFGNVAVEAMCCGTPVISTDWGAFTETVVPGLTGYRCRTLKEFVDAVPAAAGLDHERIANYAGARYSMPVVGDMYQRYFDRLATLDDGGWYQL